MSLHLAFRAREGGNGRRTSLLNLAFKWEGVGVVGGEPSPSVLCFEQGGSRGVVGGETSPLHLALRARFEWEGVGGVVGGEPSPSVLHFEQGGSRGVVGGETSPLCLALEQGRDGQLVTEKNAPSVLHLEQGRGLGAG